MKAEIKEFFSADIDDFEIYHSEDNNFAFSLQLSIGINGEDGAELFELWVCSPEWLMVNKSKTDILFGQYYLIMFEYNYERLYDYLKTFVESIEGDTWDEIAEKIARVARWEFQDYQPYKK